MAEIAVFKVSTRFTSKIKKVAVSPKEVKFFLLSSYVLGNPPSQIFPLEAIWQPPLGMDRGFCDRGDREI